MELMHVMAESHFILMIFICLPPVFRMFFTCLSPGPVPTPVLGQMPSWGPGPRYCPLKQK